MPSSENEENLVHLDVELILKPTTCRFKICVEDSTTWIESSPRVDPSILITIPGEIERLTLQLLLIWRCCTIWDVFKIIINWNSDSSSRAAALLNYFSTLMKMLWLIFCLFFRKIWRNDHGNITVVNCQSAIVWEKVREWDHVGGMSRRVVI